MTVTEPDDPGQAALPDFWPERGAEVRFWTSVAFGDGCWEWTGSLSTDGYGLFSCRSRNVRAHRFSYEYFIGPIPEGLLVRHMCHNRPCVRPDHLRVGTNQDNMYDLRVKRGITPTDPERKTMKTEEYVGQHVREARERMTMTQDELGQRLGTWLERPWSRQAVSAAEAGRRAFTAAELVALAGVLEVEPAWLITPPGALEAVELPSGNLDTDVLRRRTAPTDLRGELTLVIRNAVRAQEATGQTLAAAEALFELLGDLVDRRTEAHRWLPNRAFDTAEA